MPDRILQYKILEDLGKGRYGYMYRAVDSIENVEVLLEQFERPLIADPESRELFLETMRRLATVDSQYLVRFFALEESDGAQVLAREFIDGESIDQWRQGKWEYEQYLDVLSKTVRCLSAAHERDVVHGHLACSDIWIDRRGLVRITGFGLPSPPTSGSDLPFRSPEQLSGHPPTQLSDLYALGVIFYRVLTDEFPFRGDLPAEMAESIEREKPRYSPATTKGFPPDVRLMIDNLLRYDPKERFQSCRELLVTLDEMQAFHGREKQVTEDQARRESPQKYMLIALIVLVVVLVWIIAYNLLT